MELMSSAQTGRPDQTGSFGFGHSACICFNAFLLLAGRKGGEKKMTVEKVKQNTRKGNDGEGGTGFC